MNTKFQKQDVNNDIIFVMQQNSVIVYRGHPEKVSSQFVMQIKTVYSKKLCLKTKNIGAVTLVCSKLVRLVNGLQ